MTDRPSDGENGVRRGFKKGNREGEMQQGGEYSEIEREQYSAS